MLALPSFNILIFARFLLKIRYSLGQHIISVFTITWKFILKFC